MSTSPEPKDLVLFTKESLEFMKQRIAKKCKEEHEDNDSQPIVDLEVGKELPFAYGKLSPDMVSVPLEDVDPHYNKNTFMAINKRRRIFRFNAMPTWCTLSPFSPTRRIMIKVLVHPFFRLLILISVLTDCIFMTMTDVAYWRPILEDTLLGIYTIEILVKLIARGMWAGPFSFVGDPWNWLDFSVTLFEFITRYSLPGFASILNIVRTLRILKIIPLNQGMKSLVGILNRCVKKLAGVIMLTLLFLGIFSLIGMGLFMGNLKHKCLWWPQENENETLHNRTENTYNIPEVENFYYLVGERYALLCGNRTDASQCPEGYMCVKTGGNPDFGYTNFDNFGWALLALFRLMTQDYPEALYHQILYASGKVYMIFFVVVSFWFAFYMASLFLSILAMAYEEEKPISTERAKKSELKHQPALEELQEGKTAAETKTIQIEMKTRSPTSMSTCVDMLDDATLRYKEAVKGSRKKCPLCWYRCAKIFFIWDCSPCWLKLKEFAHKIIMDPFTDLALIICIILNTLFLALEHYPMSDETSTLLGIGNLVFLGIFTIEMIFKIIAMDPYGYFQVGWNVFDSLVVLTGLADIFIAEIEGLALLQSFVVLRIFKLGKYWPTFTHLMWALNKSLVALENLVLLLFTFILFSAILGLKIFGASYKNCVCNINDDCQLPHWHMNDFFHSYMNVLRILCGEWIETLWDCMQVANRVTCIPFYMMVLLIGNLLILYLFLVLVSSFSSYKSSPVDENKYAKNAQLAVARIRKAINFVLLKTICKKKNSPRETMENLSEMYVKETISDNTLSELNNTQDFPKDKEKSSCTEKNTMNDNESQSLIPSPSISETVPIASGESDIENLDHKEIRSKSGNGSSKEKIKQSSSSECSTVDIDFSEEEIVYEHEKAKYLKDGQEQRSLPSQTSRESKNGKIWKNIRKTCCKIVENIWFQCFIGLVTLLSTGALAFEDIYINQRKTIKILLEYADMIFAYVFILEMLLKWMAYGFKAYFTNAWYRLDFMVVIVFCLSLIGKSREDLRPLTSIKFLRALRVLSQFERMKVVVRALIKTTLPTVNVFLVCLMIWLGFSIMGVQLLAGKFYECIDPTNGERFSLSEVINKSQCESLLFNESVSWKNAELNFDHVGNGFLSLLQVATFNGWITIMNSAIDSTSVTLQPHFENNIYMYLYFIIFIIFGLFIPLSMLIGAIVANFNKYKIKGGSSIFMTAKQKKQCRGLKKLMSEDSDRPVPRPRNKFQRFIFDLVTNQIFTITVMVLIFAYPLALTMETDDASPQMQAALFWINTLFVLLYTGECLLKLTSFRCYYFTNVWNVFDFMVVVFSITGLLLPIMAGHYLASSSLVQLILLSRTLHILRLGKGPKVFHNLMLPLMLSLPALLNLSLLIFLVMFVYAIFGMYNFAYVKKEAGINDVSNFETFGSSMLCLFQVTIFAGWDGMLSAIFNSKSDCDPNKINPGTQIKGDCGNPYFGIIYFVSYIFLSWLIIVNMYIVVVMAFFNIVSKKQAKSLSEDDFRKFFQVWKRFDPERTQYIDSSKLSDFAAALDPPLLMAKPNKGQLIAMDLPMAVGDRIHCLDILLALTKRVLGKDEGMEKVLSEIETGFLLANPFKITYEPITTTLKRKQEAVSATIIQRAYKSYRLRRNDKNVSDIHMIDDHEDVKDTKGDKHFDKAVEKSTSQGQI